MLLLCLTILCSDLENAIAAMNRGDLNTAYRLFLPIAEKGDTKAMLTIGQFFHNGAPDFPRNYEKAMDWYLRAWEKDDLFSANNIGVMFRDGLGVNQDLIVAAALFELVIERGRENPNAAETALRNMGTLKMIASSRQLEESRKLGQSLLTSAALGKRRGADAIGSPAESQALIEWKSLENTYSLVSPTSKIPEVTQLRKETFSPYGIGSDQIEYETPNDGYFTSPEKHFRVKVPFFPSGKVSIHQSSSRGGYENQVRFEEDGPKGSGFIAVVVSTKIPPAENVDGERVLTWAESTNKQNLELIPRGAYHMSRVTGPWGEMVQVVVANRFSTPGYPMSQIKIMPPSQGLKCLGINRIGFYKNYLVEVGIIVPGGEESKLVPLAEQALNQLMGSLELL